MSSFLLESHPGKPLVNHLNNVSKVANSILDDMQKYYPFFQHKSINQTLEIICLTHDLGKSTSFFQEYLYGKKPEDSFLKSHSTLSSLYCYYICKDIVNDDFFSFISLMAVQGHHGIIPNPSQVIKRIYNHSNELKKQFNNIKYIDEIDFFLIEKLYPKFRDCNSILNCLNKLDLKRRSFILSLAKLDQLYPYFIINMLFSILIDADRIDAANLNYDKLKILSPNIDTISIEKYIKKIENKAKAKAKFDNEFRIIKLRSLVRDTVLKKAHDTKHKLFSLTAPTGSGKTLTAFLFATILRNKIVSNLKRKPIPKIIYVLPFLSIIDQNTEVLRNAIGLKKTTIQSPIIITHHHLAKLNYKDITNEYYSESKSQLIIEGWNAELVITTFVQFLETIIGSTASSLRKLHNLTGSIIILDEVQAIDYQYWLLIRECLLFLTKEFDVRIILMTATQPLIFKKEVFELFDVPQIYPGYVTFIPDLRPISLIDLYPRLIIL